MTIYHSLYIFERLFPSLVYYIGLGLYDLYNRRSIFVAMGTSRSRLVAQALKNLYMHCIMYLGPLLAEQRF